MARRTRAAAGRALRWTIAAARLPLHVRPELRDRLPDLLVDGRRHRRPAPAPARSRRDVRIRLTSTAGEAAGLQTPHGLEYSLGLHRAHRLQLRPRLLEQRRADARVGRADGRAAAAHRRAQRQLDGHRSRWLSHGAVWVQLVPTRRRHRLPHLLDDGPRSGVSDGLLPDPRPRTEGPRRGRGLAGLDPPARRVRERVTRAEATYTSTELGRRLELGTRAGCAAPGSRR